MRSTREVGRRKAQDRFVKWRTFALLSAAGVRHVEELAKIIFSSDAHSQCCWLEECTADDNDLMASFGDLPH